MLSSLPPFWEISAFSHTWKPRATCWEHILAPPLVSPLPWRPGESRRLPGVLGTQVSVAAGLFGNVLLWLCWVNHIVDPPMTTAP